MLSLAHLLIERQDLCSVIKERGTYLTPFRFHHPPPLPSSAHKQISMSLYPKLPGNDKSDFFRFKLMLERNIQLNNSYAKKQVTIHNHKSLFQCAIIMT